MKNHDFLSSPYLQQLPIHCLSKTPFALSKIEKSKFVLLLNIVSNHVYLVDKRILNELNNNYPKNLQKSVALDSGKYFRDHRYFGIEIEINTHCNHKCTFCPNAYHEQPIEFMSMEEYKHIVYEAASCGIKNISLNHYSEPTLHPNLIEMATFAERNGFQITLFTNGSGFSNELISSLTKFSKTIEIVVNFPECSTSSYKQVTQSNNFSDIVSQLQQATISLPIKIAVNNPNQSIVRSIAKLFPKAMVQQWDTDDRAGMLNIPHYTTSQRHSKKFLNGCPLAARFINVSVDGDIFLCAQDFNKTNVFGNIFKKSLKTIIEGQIVQNYKKMIFGIESPPQEFICRYCKWTTNKVGSFSIGRKLSNYDKEVYIDIVQKNPIIVISGADKWI